VKFVNLQLNKYYGGVVKVTQSRGKDVCSVYSN